MFSVALSFFFALCCALPFLRTCLCFFSRPLLDKLYTIDRPSTQPPPFLSQSHFSHPPNQQRRSSRTHRSFAQIQHTLRRSAGASSCRPICNIDTKRALLRDHRAGRTPTKQPAKKHNSPTPHPRPRRPPASPPRAFETTPRAREWGADSARPLMRSTCCSPGCSPASCPPDDARRRAGCEVLLLQGGRQLTERVWLARVL